MGLRYLDAARFDAIPIRKAITVRAGGTNIRQSNRAEAWIERWRHTPFRAFTEPGCDMLYVRCQGEEVYHRRLLVLFGRFGNWPAVRPHADLIAFPRPCSEWYSIADRRRWGEDSARESRLRWRTSDHFFHLWHCTEFFSVPVRVRPSLYPALPTDWASYEAPEHLCVPTPSVMAYVASRWIGSSPAAPGIRQRGLIRAIALSEWAALALLCFLGAARDGLPFVTRSPDARLAARRGHQEQGVLFRLSPGLISLIRSVGIAPIVEGSEFHAGHTEELLAYAETRRWRDDAEFIWYDFSTGVVPEIPRPGELLD